MLNLCYCVDIILSLSKPFEVARNRLRIYIIASIIFGLIFVSI